MLEFSNLIELLSCFWLPWESKNVWHTIFFFLPYDIRTFVSWVISFIICGSIFNVGVKIGKVMFPSGLG